MATVALCDPSTRVMIRRPTTQQGIELNLIGSAGAMVARKTSNLEVAGSSPARNAFFAFCLFFVFPIFVALFFSRHCTSYHRIHKIT